METYINFRMDIVGSEIKVLKRSLMTNYGWFAFSFGLLVFEIIFSIYIKPTFLYGFATGMVLLNSIYSLMIILDIRSEIHMNKSFVNSLEESMEKQHYMNAAKQHQRAEDYYKDLIREKTGKIFNPACPENKTPGSESQAVEK